MALQKRSLNINFGGGLDTKTDPFQVQVGSMLSLENSIFTKGGLLQKRNGFQSLTALSNSSTTTLSTYENNLVAIGSQFNVYSNDTTAWLNRGTITPCSLSVTPAVRTSANITVCDVAVASNSLACVVYLDSSGNSFYEVIDSNTGQIVVSNTQLPATAAMARVFALGQNFIITFLATVGTTHLQYIAIPISNPSNPLAAVDLSTQVSSLSAAYDGFVANNSVYLAWNGSDGGGAIRVTSLDSSLLQHATVVISGETANLISVTSNGSSLVWITWWNSGSTNGFTAAYNLTLISVLTKTQVITGKTVPNLTSSSTGGSVQIFYSNQNTYSFSSTRSDFVNTVNCTSGGSVGSTTTIARSLGLASKSFYFSPTATHYFLGSYAGTFQPTYFLMDQSGNEIAKLAYGNGAGYPANQILPSVTQSGNNVWIGYLLKDQLVPVNKAQGVTGPANIYAQIGVNIVEFTIQSAVVTTSEIGNNLHTTGGFMWMYDGAKPVEHGFHLWPEDIGVNIVHSGGSITTQQYYYYVVYAWTDLAGNVHRSAPSIPVSANVTSASNNTVQLFIPTLRLTYKISPNSARIEIYRWSTAQQIPYLVTSITSPTLNDTTVDSIQYNDTLADSSILGNLILYTTGGVVEDIAAPSVSAMTLFKSRLFAIDAEDPNTIWFSKQVIEATPVEMSDLFTIFVAPTISAQGTTGPITALSSMDDKLIIFKKNAIYYITGNGPDNTGANNDFSDPVFITSTVGCTNQRSIVFMPQGVMFQSDKGIWLLGRDLSTTYVGAAVEQFNSNTVLSAIVSPGTNQVRFTLDNGITLMYDYFYGKWGTFVNVPGISSTVFQSLHTFVNSKGQVYQESPGVYLDGGDPVLLSFTTGWVNLMGLQGYQRAYYFYLLGQYQSPHKLVVSVAYDYSSAASQTTTVIPTNFNQPYGSDPLYGDGNPFGGNPQVEQWRVFLTKQKCQAFQIQVSEVYDPSFAVGPGAGLTLSGINLVVGGKLGYVKVPSTQSVG